MSKIRGYRQAVEIERRDYQPSNSYQLDAEIIRMSDFRTRVKRVHLQRPHRIAFHLLIFITDGQCDHIVDFNPVRCKSGSLLLLRPSQIEQFDLSYDWDGWLVLFRPEFLFTSELVCQSDCRHLVAALQDFPEHLVLGESEDGFVRDALPRMLEDSRRDGSRWELNDLLRYHLSALILRINLAHRSGLLQRKVSYPEASRFKRFQQLVEQKFANWHKVTEYAKALGCSERSLARAAREAADSSAKALITNRINLEAKRLLVHTTRPIAQIASDLGFDEVTNFIKFFKREVGYTPAEFRLIQVRGAQEH